jgi:putative oxidoreductase
MKQLISTFFYPGKHQDAVSFALLVLRAGLGIFMLTHGAGKFLRIFGDEPIRFADPIGLGPVVSFGLVVFAEFFCSAFLILGFASRVAAIPLVIAMLVAGLIVHAGEPFGNQELPLFYALVSFFILFTGAGRFSLDQLIYKRLKK